MVDDDVADPQPQALASDPIAPGDEQPSTAVNSIALVDAVDEDNASRHSESEEKLDCEQEPNLSNANTPATKKLPSPWVSFVILVIPLLLALAIIMCLALIVLTGLTSVFITLIAIAAIPVGAALWFLPRLQLMGYEQLSGPESSIVTGKKSKKWDRLKRNDFFKRSRSVVDSIPWMSEVFELVTLSDFVYLFSDFRRMSLMGKIPVQFKYLALECDHMNQWDIIRGKPHTQPAFDEDGKGHAGVRSSTIVVLLLRILFNKKTAYGRRMRIQSKRGDETYRGLKELEQLIAGVMKDTSCPCHR